jgi:hypothetical protein
MEALTGLRYLFAELTQINAEYLALERMSHLVPLTEGQKRVLENYRGAIYGLGQRIADEQGPRH